MNEQLSPPQGDPTRDADLADWNVFCLVYYELILRALRLLRVPEDDIEDLTHGFLIKAGDREFLDKFRLHRKREGLAGRQAKFRAYLYRSLQHFVCDWYREKGRSPEMSLVPDQAAALSSPGPASIDPDALYALVVLHHALQSLRRHCERIGKPHLWVIFEETFLANEFRGRPGMTRAELLRDYPGKDFSFLDDSLTTAKRAFRRIVLEVMPLGLREHVSPAERFAEWMQILARSNASQFGLLNVAYRVAPFVSSDNSLAKSSGFVVDWQSHDPGFDDDLQAIRDDELSILLGFRLELPMVEMIEGEELQQLIPSNNPFWPNPRKRTAPARPGTPRTALKPLCLLTLIDPTPAEREALAGIDLFALLKLLKTHFRQIRNRPDHGLPANFIALFYTTIILLALKECGKPLHTIDDASLSSNVDYFLAQSWVDDRLRALLKSGVALGRGRRAAADHVP